MKSLIQEYQERKKSIKGRLKEFRKIAGAKDREVFAELSFCILTPGSRALNADEAVRRLKKRGLLFRGSREQIAKLIRGLVRLHNNKASYIVAAREVFRRKKRLDIKRRLNEQKGPETREWLVKNIKGLGYKEASHFLRNIGFGEEIAILDTHILKNLKRYRVINKIPDAISKKAYLDIEDRMRSFSRRIKIPMQELDLLFWSKQTGFVFK